MLFGSQSFAEEPISSTKQEIILVPFQDFENLPIDLPLYYIIATKALCWTVDGESELAWTFDDCDEDWTFTDGASEWIADNTCDRG